ncbi:MAG: hypothetical protein FJ135_12690 [Deltaproteobacteria bacterium]|nr:hypothetical protein [Deltaproteobacteria bacterium]
MVSLEYRGPESQLAELGYEIARKRLEHRVKMEQIEAEARRMLVPPHAEPMEEQAETVAEFFPDGAVEEEQAGPEGEGGVETPSPEPGVGEVPGSVTEAEQVEEASPTSPPEQNPGKQKEAGLF